MSSLKMNPISRIIIATFASISLTGCYNTHEMTCLPGIENVQVMEVVLPYAINLQHDKKLFLEDSVVYYGGQGTYIEGMRLSFTSQSIIELKAAREMLVDIADGLIDSLNQDPVLGPLISGFPLSTDDLEICIKFESFLGFYVDKAYIHWLVLQDGKSFFYAFDMTNEFSRRPLLSSFDIQSECWHERVEPFYKSRQIVAIQRAAEQIYKDKQPKVESLFSGDRFGGILETNRASIRGTEL